MNINPKSVSNTDSPRIFFWQRGINWEYYRHHTHFVNDKVDNTLWFFEEEKVFRIALSKPLFEIHNTYYDGHTVKGFTFLGLSITWAYSYHSRRTADIRKTLAPGTEFNIDKFTELLNNYTDMPDTDEEGQAWWDLVNYAKGDK